MASFQRKCHSIVMAATYISTRVCIASSLSNHYPYLLVIVVSFITIFFAVIVFVGNLCSVAIVLGVAKHVPLVFAGVDDFSYEHFIIHSRGISSLSHIGFIFSISQSQ